MKFMHIIDIITNRSYYYRFDAISIQIIGDILHVFSIGCHDKFNLKKCTYELVGEARWT